MWVLNCCLIYNWSEAKKFIDIIKFLNVAMCYLWNYDILVNWSKSSSFYPLTVWLLSHLDQSIFRFFHCLKECKESLCALYQTIILYKDSTQNGWIAKQISSKVRFSISFHWTCLILFLIYVHSISMLISVFPS